MICWHAPCIICGAAIADPALHQGFHDGLREMGRRIEAPDMSPEEYNQPIEEAWDRDRPGWRGSPQEHP